MWQARPVFVSSTFHDMQAERDHLRTHVFPELEERLRARHVNLEWVDLRLGVVSESLATESAREQRVLKVCLAEARRCRPFLIVLLGDRYGWVPPRDRAAPAVLEEGVGGDVAGSSVTELEIQVGLFSAPDPQPRCFVYLRGPLPYQEMAANVAAQYSDAHDGDSTAASRAERLSTLKQGLEAAFPARVRHYEAAWDQERGRVTGLDGWGRVVLEDLWSALTLDFPADDRKVPATQAELNAVVDFAAERARDFVGRERLVASLLRIAASSIPPAPAPPGAGAPEGACITGKPGSGKSALFGELLRRLRATDALVLGHSTGASPQATSVDAMLRGFIGELASALDVDAHVSEATDAGALDSTFASLLGKASGNRRVILLIDGLDEFEQTPRGRFLTWLPRQWPSNARIIATALAGNGSQALGDRVSLEMVAMPPLDAGEARHIAKAVCARYHRILEPDVLEALLARSSPAGLACASPLWLILAVEELNLLDADDFDRAQREYSGTPAERIRQLLRDLVADLPVDVAGLCRRSFNRAEELFGARFAQVFLALIAVSRGGWRETEFRSLLPRLTSEAWDGLRFASLRRLFRGQIKQHGTLGQWEFDHAQMRAAARALANETMGALTALHTAIANHLLALDAGDPLRVTETMVHLVGSGDRRRAAAYYGDPELSDAAVQGATRVLMDAIVRPAAFAPPASPDTVNALLDDWGLEAGVRSGVARRLLFFLVDALEGHAELDTRLALIGRLEAAFRELMAQQPGHTEYLSDLSVAQNKAGSLLRAAGRREDSLAAYQGAVSTFQALADSEPKNLLWQHGLSLTFQNIGDLLFAGSKPLDAMAAYVNCLGIDRRLAEIESTNPRWQLSFAASLERLGRTFRAAGERAKSLEAYQSSHAIVSKLVRADPRNVELRTALVSSFHGLGEALADSGRREEALTAYTDALSVAQELSDEDPGDVQRRDTLAISCERVGEALFVAAKAVEARVAYEQSLTIRQRLAAADPANVRWQRDVANSLERIGDTLDFMGRGPEALERYGRGIAILEELLANDAGNREWQRALALSLQKMGDTQGAGGLSDEALTTYRRSLTICRALLSDDPNDARLQQQLAKCTLSAGDALDDLGRLDEALASYEESLAIREKLAVSDPGHAGWQADVAAALNRVGNVLASLGRSDDALLAYRRSLSIDEPLAQADPGDAMLQVNVAIGRERIGTLLSSSQLGDAVAEYRESIAIHERLVASHDKEDRQWVELLLSSCERLRDLLDGAHADGLEWQQERMLLNSRIGDLHSQLGQLGLALAAYQQQLAAASALAAARPDDADRQRIVSVCYSRLGDVLTAMGSPEDALEMFRKDLAIAEKLEAADPGQAGCRWDLSISHLRVGDALAASNRSSEALASFQDGVRIREALTAQEPENTRWLYGLAVVYNRIADAQLALSRDEDALASCQQLLAIAGRLSKLDPGDADRREGLAQSYEKLGSVLRQMGRHEEALEAIRNGAAIRNK